MYTRGWRKADCLCCQQFGYHVWHNLRGKLVPCHVTLRTPHQGSWAYGHLDMFPFMAFIWRLVSTLSVVLRGSSLLTMAQRLNNRQTFSKQYCPPMIQTSNSFLLTSNPFFQILLNSSSWGIKETVKLFLYFFEAEWGIVVRHQGQCTCHLTLLWCWLFNISDGGVQFFHWSWVFDRVVYLQLVSMG